MVTLSEAGMVKYIGGWTGLLVTTRENVKTPRLIPARYLPR